MAKILAMLSAIKGWLFSDVMKITARIRKITPKMAEKRKLVSPKAKILRATADTTCSAPILTTMTA